jgi:hypothetical protein
MAPPGGCGGRALFPGPSPVTRVADAALALRGLWPISRLIVPGAVLERARCAIAGHAFPLRVALARDL